MLASGFDWPGSRIRDSKLKICNKEYKALNISTMGSFVWAVGSEGIVCGEVEGVNDDMEYSGTKMRGNVDF